VAIHAAYDVHDRLSSLSDEAIKENALEPISRSRARLFYDDLLGYLIR
jgi:hypothetical protein